MTACALYLCSYAGRRGSAIGSFWRPSVNNSGIKSDDGEYCSTCCYRPPAPIKANENGPRLKHFARAEESKEFRTARFASCLRPGQLTVTFWQFRESRVHARR
jgi:hypothetical protein